MLFSADFPGASGSLELILPFINAFSGQKFISLWAGPKLSVILLWKTFLSLQTLLPFFNSLSPHHFTCFLPSTACLCLAEMGGCGLWDRTRPGVSWLVRWVMWWQLPSKGAWHGKGRAKLGQGAGKLCRALLCPSALPDLLLHHWVCP